MTVVKLQNVLSEVFWHFLNYFPAYNIFVDLCLHTIFVTATSPPYPHLKLDEKDLSLCLSFDIRLLSENSSLSVVLEAEEGLYVITYTSGQVSSYLTCLTSTSHPDIMDLLSASLYKFGFILSGFAWFQVS